MDKNKCTLYNEWTILYRNLTGHQKIFLNIIEETIVSKFLIVSDLYLVKLLEHSLTQRHSAY